MNLAPTDRWKAAIEGKALRHSADLHGGVARSLALLGTHGHDIAPSGGPSGTEWAYYAVRDLLEDTNADATGDTWASLSGLLPLLAEAAPDVFAHAVTAGLSGDDPVLSRISKTERKTTASRRTHRTPGCCGRSRISAGRPTTWVSQPSVSHASRSLTPAVGSPNRPSASLASIFTPWHPKNTATPARRLAIIDGLRARHPAVAWKLLLSMLPKRNGTHFPTHRRLARDWKPRRQTVLMSDYLAFINEILKRVLEDVGASENRWSNSCSTALAKPAAGRTHDGSGPAQVSSATGRERGRRPRGAVGGAARTSGPAPRSTPRRTGRFPNLTSPPWKKLQVSWLRLPHSSGHGHSSRTTARTRQACRVATTTRLNKHCWRRGPLPSGRLTRKPASTSCATLAQSATVWEKAPLG